MTVFNEKPIPSESPAADRDIQPSWKPLLWFVVGLTVLIAAAEILFDILLETLELIGEAIFYLVEGGEELFIEDKIEEWFDLDARDAELITAWTITPLKILLAFFIVRWIWRFAHGKFIPKALRWSMRHYTAVRLAWQQLAWPFKALLVIGAISGLLIFI
jgi:hypothetical protein